MDALQTLPAELLLMIFDELDACDKKSFVRTNRCFYERLNGLLYVHNARFAFRRALSTGNLATARFAHEAGKTQDPEQWTEQLHKSTFKAVQSGSTRKVALYLAIGVNPSIEQDKRPKTLLEAAVIVNHTKMLQLLLSQPGYNPGIRGSEALEFATRLAHTDSVRVLLEAPNIYPNHLSRYNYTPVCWGVKSGSLETLRQFFRPGIIDRIDFNKCSDPSKTEEQASREPWNAGRSPLILAAFKNRIDMARLLLSAPGINVHQRDNEKLTALHYAIGNRNLDLVGLLIEHGADTRILRTARRPILEIVEEEEIEEEGEEGE